MIFEFAIPIPDDSETSPRPGGEGSAGRPPKWWNRLAAYSWLWGLALVVFILDQTTKAWVITRIPYVRHPAEWPPEASISVIEGFFHLVHVGNTGAAWSLFEGRSGFLALLAVLTLIGIYLWRHQLGLRDRSVQVAFGLLVGGILGNFVDRVLHGHVIDFLDFHFGTYIYPTFNLADVGICCGVVLYMWFSLRGSTTGDGADTGAGKR